MRNAFTNSDRLQVIFTEESVTFYGVDRQAVYFPYGSLDLIKMSMLGILQAASGKRICSFAVAHKDRAQVKEMVRYARDAMKTAPREECRLIDLSGKADADQVPADLPAAEQLRRYKALFVQGVISREEYDVAKRRLQASFPQ